MPTIIGNDQVDRRLPLRVQWGESVRNTYKTSSSKSYNPAQSTPIPQSAPVDIPNPFDALQNGIQEFQGIFTLAWVATAGISLWVLSKVFSR